MPPRLPRRTCDEDEIGAVLVAPFGNFDAPGGYHCKTSGELAPIARACSNVITVDPFPAAERPFAGNLRNAVVHYSRQARSPGPHSWDR